MLKLGNRVLCLSIKEHLTVRNLAPLCSKFHTLGKAAKESNEFLTRPQAPFTAGQPLYETRPYTVSPGDLTPGISALEYYERRMRLMSNLPRKSIVILTGDQIKFASGSVFYPFQQNNDLFYYTGWDEPDSVAIIEKPTDNNEELVLHMVVPPKDPAVEQWEGQRTGVDGAIDIFNADESASTQDLAKYITKLVQRNDNIWWDQIGTGKANTPSAIFSSFFTQDPKAKEYSTINELLNKSTGKKIKPLNPLTREMRVVKSTAELAVMRRAGQISGRAFNQAYARRFRTERSLAAFLESRFISGGCNRSAYVPVVAAGLNSLCIHYTRNDDIMYDDEMVLVDAAGSLGGYASDISRTWPVSGKFTDAQKDLYQAVLNVEKQCIEMCTVSHNVSLHDLHMTSVMLMTQELRQIGFKDLQEWETQKLYPHYIGHNLGLDVHDVPKTSRSAKLRKGQVVTVEPGVYVPDDERYPKHFRNVGIRIEDDIAVGSDTYQILTVEAAKEIVDIESIAENGVTTPYDEECVYVDV